jgi:hypothetical protein
MRGSSCIIALFVVGCATTSDVVPMGTDKYMVGYQVRGGLTSWGEVKATAVQKATTFCLGKDKKIEVLDIQTSGAQGWTPQNADVTFKCI